MANTYWRITFKNALDKNRTVWATKFVERRDGTTVSFFIVNKEGDEPEPRQMVWASKVDIIRKQPAELSKMYAWLEVVK